MAHLKKSRIGAQSAVEGTTEATERILDIQERRMDRWFEREEKHGRLMLFDNVVDAFQTLGHVFRNAYMNAERDALEDWPGGRDDAERFLRPRLERLLEDVCRRIEAEGKRVTSRVRRGGTPASRSNGG